MTYYPIDENLAREATRANSFRDYQTGSATADYQKVVDEAKAIADAQKAKVSPYYHGKIDALLEKFSRKLAAWYNAYNRNAASCPSVMIAGPAGISTRKKEKQFEREGALYKEHDEIYRILDRIRGVGMGAVELTDPDAKEILTEQLEANQWELEHMKEINKYFRKNKTVKGFPGISDETAAKLDDGRKPFSDFRLTSCREKIKRIQKRLDDLEKLQKLSENPDDGQMVFDGGKVIKNGELNRLQILFDDKPDDEMREKLKSRGFRWSQKNKAWQRQLTDNAVRAVKEILEIE